MFDKRGVKVIALSSDGQDRPQAIAAKLSAPGLRIGYGLGLASAREWGLSISTSRGTTSIGIEEPALFSGPGVFIVRPDGTLYYGAVQTMPFARPHFDELLAAIDFALAKGYPARGEYAGAVWALRLSKRSCGGGNWGAPPNFLQPTRISLIPRPGLPRSTPVKPQET